MYMSKEIMEKLKEHDGRFDAHDEQIELLALKLAEHDGWFERLTALTTDHTARLDRIEENMVTKAEYHADRHRLFQTLDKILLIVEKKDQEVAMLHHGMRRIEKHVGLA